MPELDSAHYRVVIIGGGQAGLSMSYHLVQHGVDHLVLERDRVGYEWRERRWDSFCLVTPNWQCQLPGFPYTGSDPDGFMRRDEVVRYLRAYVDSFAPPLVEGVEVTRLRRERTGGFRLATNAGTVTADQVVVATGPYQLPAAPPEAGRLPDSVAQLHSSQYRGAAHVPDGAVLVVGSGQSGCQIAEDLHLAGRKVHLSVGTAPRVARRYRGLDVVAWLDRMGYYDKAVDELGDAEAIRLRANHYVTGRDGGRDIDLRALARGGMRLHGRLHSLLGGRLHFAADLARNLDHADAVSESIKDSIDQFIAGHGLDAPVERRYRPVWQPPFSPAARDLTLDLTAAGIRTVIWCTGFGRDYRWIEVPVFDGRGYPTHERGVTQHPGLYFLGLPWLHSWGSGRFSAVGRDAWYLTERVLAHDRHTWTDEVRWIAGTPTETYPDREWYLPRTAVS